MIAVISISAVSVVIVSAKPDGKSFLTDNLTTKNFIEEMKYVNHKEIKGLCTYDFCDYLFGESLEEGLENYTKSYLRTIKDDEVRFSLLVKGFRITEVIMQN